MQYTDHPIWLPQLYEYPFPQVTMRCEPYIAIKGPRVGEIEWFEGKTPTGASVKLYMDDGEIWQPYADFERGKLRELQNVKVAYDGFDGITVSCVDCYWVLLSRKDCEDKKCQFPWQELSGDRLGEKQHCHHYGSKKLTDYSPSDYCHDSESSRLLARARFLKAVCEK